MNIWKSTTVATNLHHLSAQIQIIKFVCVFKGVKLINFMWILSNFCKKKYWNWQNYFFYFMKVLFDNTAISQVKNYAHKHQFFMFYILKFHAPIWLSSHTVKFRKLALGLIFFKGPFWGAYFWRGLSTEGNLRLKIDWASLIVGSKFTFFAFFYFVFEGNFPITSPRGAYI